MNIEKRREKLKRRILDFLAKGQSLRAACEKAGISRVSVNKWREKDPEFGACVQEYLEAKLPGNLEEPELTAPEILKLTEPDRSDPSGSPAGLGSAMNQHRPEKDTSISQLAITLRYRSPE